MSATAKVWFTVTTRDAEQAVQAYLYSHTAIIARTEGWSGSKHLLLETTAESHDRALHFANYQAERLASGLHGVSTVSDSKDAALRSHEERTGVLIPTQERPCSECSEGTHLATSPEHAVHADAGSNVRSQGDVHPNHKKDFRGSGALLSSRLDAEKRVRLAVAAKGDVLSQGRFIPGDAGLYPAVPVIRLQGHGQERCYLTHLAFVTDDGRVTFETGHYDLTWAEANEDLAQR